jgi:hypothetical protein
MKDKKQIINKKKVDKLFNSFKKNDLLEDRSEYDEEDLQLAYPDLNKKEVKLLYLKIQQWKYSKEKKKRPNKLNFDNKFD